MGSPEWTRSEHVQRYLERADEFPRRVEGESVLLDHVPREARRVLDLGTGDGRVVATLRADRPELVGVGLDFSPDLQQRGRAEPLPRSFVGFSPL